VSDEQEPVEPDEDVEFGDEPDSVDVDEETTEE
jgi:hypothetical protein